MMPESKKLKLIICANRDEGWAQFSRFQAVGMLAKASVSVFDPWNGLKWPGEKNLICNFFDKN